LHQFARLDDHHCHREAPPDQQEAGSNLKLELDRVELEIDGAGWAGSGGNASRFGPSTTFDASTAFGLERVSEGSFGDREEILAILASLASPAARGKLADGLTSARIRRVACVGRSGAGKGGGTPIFAANDRLALCAGSGSDVSPFSR
jgi:hypothetical protein